MFKVVALLLVALVAVNAGCGWRDAISCGKTVHKVFKQCYNGNMEDFDVVECAQHSLSIYKDDNCFDCFCSLIPVVGQACEIFELNKLNESLEAPNQITAECAAKRKPCYLECLEFNEMPEFEKKCMKEKCDAIEC